MLTGKTINGKEYEHCPQVSNEFEMKTMKDYHNLYLQCGVLLLAGVFEKFRNNSLKHYGLFQSHYLRVAALIWDTIPNMKKVELEPISDLDMYILLEKCMRGEILIFLIDIVKPTISLLYAVTQNESKHIIYIDANNLYGHAMSIFLPTSSFKWLDPKKFYLNKYTSNRMCSKGEFKQDVLSKLILNI